MNPPDDYQNPTEPVDESNFLEEMRTLYELDPDEALARLEEAGYTVEDLDL